MIGEMLPATDVHGTVQVVFRFLNKNFFSLAAPDGRS